MDISTLRSFVAVAHSGSFRQAAATRGLTQPGVSRHVQRLESELGVALFDREPTGAVLTPAGEQLLAYAADAVERHDRVIGALTKASRADIKGELRIAASTTPGEALLPELLSEFTELHPRVRPEVFVADSAVVADEVRDAKWDVGFVGARGRGRGLTYDVVAEDELMLAVPERHPFAGRLEIALAELDGVPFIEREGGSGTLRAFRSALTAANLPYPRYRVVMVLNSTHAILVAVHNGFGFGIVSSLALEDHAFSHVYRAHISDLTLRREIYMVRNGRRPGSPVGQAFAEWVLARRAGQT